VYAAGWATTPFHPHPNQTSDTLHIRTRSDFLQAPNQGMPGYNECKWDGWGIPLTAAYEDGYASVPSQKFRPIQHLRLQPRCPNVGGTSVHNAESTPFPVATDDARVRGASSHTVLGDPSSYWWPSFRSTLRLPSPHPVLHPQDIPTPVPTNRPCLHVRELPPLG